MSARFTILAIALVASALVYQNPNVVTADPPIMNPGMQAENHVVRSSQIIGLQVWDVQNQQVGIVKDVVIDYEGGCPVVFVALSSEILADAEAYVLAPFDASRLQFDNRSRRSYLALEIGIDQFRNAPRLSGNDWQRLRDPQFMKQTRQFYRDVQRSAARPEARPNGGLDKRPDRGNVPESRPAPGARRNPDGGQAPAPPAPIAGNDSDKRPPPPPRKKRDDGAR